jgi:hypothetical protein
MSIGVDFVNHGTYSLDSQQSQWIGINNPAFDSEHWQKLSVFPTEQSRRPAKITIVEEDWTIDEWNEHVCWVLIKNASPYPVEFTITSIVAPSR